MKTTVTTTAIREMVNEVLDNKEYGLPYTPEAEKTPVVVDSIVDPSAAITNPGDPTFNPSDNRELSIAIHDIVKAIPDETIGPFYKKVKQVADDMLNGRDILNVGRPKKSSDEHGGDEMMKNEPNKAEEAVRLVVRKMLREMNEDNNDEELAPTGGETTVPAEPTASSVGKTRRAHGSKSSSGLAKELTPWQDVAKGMTGFLGTEKPVSVSGAKQMGDKAWRKGRFIDYHFNTPEMKQMFMIDLIDDYTGYLQSSGEVDPDDLDLLLDNPDIVADLPGFQDFMLDQLKDRLGYFPDIEFDKYSRPLDRDGTVIPRINDYDDDDILKYKDPATAKLRRKV